MQRKCSCRRRLRGRNNNNCHDVDTTRLCPVILPADAERAAFVWQRRPETRPGRRRGWCVYLETFSRQPAASAQLRNVCFAKELPEKHRRCQGGKCRSSASAHGAPTPTTRCSFSFCHYSVASLTRWKKQNGCSFYCKQAKDAFAPERSFHFTLICVLFRPKY